MESNVIQIGLIETILGVATFIFVMGVAWGSLKSDISHIKRDIGDIKNTLSKHSDNIKKNQTRIIHVEKDISHMHKNPVQYSKLHTQLLHKKEKPAS